jgi:HK97 family phage major capsid protein
LQTSGSSASWVAENPGSDVGESDSAFGNIQLQPRTLTATTSYSRDLLQQSSVDVEAFLRADLAAAHAAALDRAAFVGSGVSGEPLGLLNFSSVPVTAIGASGGAPTGAILASMEQSVADASADLGQLAWVTSPVMRYRLRQVPLFTNSSLPCWQGNELLGSPAEVTKSIPTALVKGGSSDCSLIVAGYFPSLSFASWGVLSLVVDPYTDKKRGQVQITSHQICDVVIRRPTAFALCADARNI